MSVVLEENVNTLYTCRLSRAIEKKTTEKRFAIKWTKTFPKYIILSYLSYLVHMLNKVCIFTHSDAKSTVCFV